MEREYLEFLIKNFQKAEAFLPLIKFDGDNSIHRTTVALYASIIEQISEAIFLCSDQRHSTLDIILRANLEAFVDLLNLCQSENYLDNMRAAYHKEWIRLVEKGLNGDNQYLAKFASDEKVAQKLQSHKDQLDTLVGNGTPALNVYQRFQRAGMENEYASIYNSLCSESHNNIRALTDRHLCENDTNNSIQIFSPKDSDGIIFSITTYISILVRSTCVVHRYFETECAKGVDELNYLYSVFHNSIEKNS